MESWPNMKKYSSYFIVIGIILYITYALNQFIDKLVSDKTFSVGYFLWLLASLIVLAIFIAFKKNVNKKVLCGMLFIPVGILLVFSIMSLNKEGFALIYLAELLIAVILVFSLLFKILDIKNFTEVALVLALSTNIVFSLILWLQSFFKEVYADGDFTIYSNNAYFVWLISGIFFAIGSYYVLVKNRDNNIK